MNGYELHDHLRKAGPRPFDGDFVNCLSPVISASEEILSQQAVCMSYTYREVTTIRDKKPTPQNRIYF